MPRNYLYYALLCFFLSSCAVRHHTISGIRTWSYPQNQFDKQFDFRYVDHVLEKTGNKRGAKWADRKNIHIISICLINNGKQPIHGTQLSFYNNGEKVKIMHNLWLARKVRQRISPLLLLAFPAFIVEAVLFHSHDDDYDENCNSMYGPDEEDSYITNEIIEKEFQRQADANFNLTKELMEFQLAKQILYPGKPIYGVVGIQSKSDLKDLRVISNQSNFKVLSAIEK